MSLSSHVLDATRGGPAQGVTVQWDRRDDGAWVPVQHAVTDRDGRVAGFGAGTTVGVHRLVFDSGGYFAGQGSTTFYPEVIVVFEVTDSAAHYHVPVLLSPFAYSTYRGS